LTLTRHFCSLLQFDTIKVSSQAFLNGSNFNRLLIFFSQVSSEHPERPWTLWSSLPPNWPRHRIRNRTHRSGSIPKPKQHRSRTPTTRRKTPRSPRSGAVGTTPASTQPSLRPTGSRAPNESATRRVVKFGRSMMASVISTQTVIPGSSYFSDPTAFSIEFKNFKYIFKHTLYFIKWASFSYAFDFSKQNSDRRC